MRYVESRDRRAYRPRRAAHPHVDGEIQRAVRSCKATRWRAPIATTGPSKSVARCSLRPISSAGDGPAKAVCAGSSARASDWPAGISDGAAEASGSASPGAAVVGLPTTGGWCGLAGLLPPEHFHVVAHGLHRRIMDGLLSYTAGHDK